MQSVFSIEECVDYAARLLKGLYNRIHRWDKAVAYYHTRTKHLGDAYQQRVFREWRLLAQDPEIEKIHQEVMEEMNQLRASLAEASAQTNSDAHIAPTSADDVASNARELESEANAYTEARIAEILRTSAEISVENLISNVYDAAYRDAYRDAYHDAYREEYESAYQDGFDDAYEQAFREAFEEVAHYSADYILSMHQDAVSTYECG